jgi:membrane-associated phospholipid phosphatase
MLLLGLFYYLHQLDVPTLQIVRTFTHPFVDQIGKTGDRLGDGITLTLIALGIGALGYGLNWPSWKSTGLHALLALVAGGLFAQTLKHSIGRPRPRFMQGQNWEVAPSFEIGFDSFPSGHATASFAVATVLACYFPKGKMVWFGLAAFIGACRVIKGSHYPTDILGGVLVGVITGLVLVHPLHQLKAVFRHTLVHGLPWLVAAFGLVWTLVPHPGLEVEPLLSLILGLLAIGVGFGLRFRWIYERSHTGTPSQLPSLPQWPRLLAGLGLATTTGSAVVLGAGLLAGLVWWMGNQHAPSHQGAIPQNQHLALYSIKAEATFGITFLLMALLIFCIRSQLLII